jgi:GNAT superfamily N-acetyltransferase
MTEQLLQAIQIRSLAPGDSLDELTSMLHRALSRLGRMGLNCTGFNQSLETSAQRVRLGECHVAVCDGRLIGTLTRHKPDRRSDCRWYRQPDVASVHQFAVDPGFQGTGCGKALRLVATRWAREHDYAELALDTPALASHLIEFYVAQGFRIVEHVKLPGKTCLSAVFSHMIDLPAASREPRHHAQPVRNAPLFGTMVQR